MTAAKMKIKKGDKVVVLTGKDKGSKGEVLKVYPVERPIHASNVSLIDPKSDKPTRVGFKVAKDGTKTRIARRSGEVIE
jgi:large subunit ribosomal protein L24